MDMDTDMGIYTFAHKLTIEMKENLPIWLWCELCAIVWIQVCVVTGGHRRSGFCAANREHIRGVQ